MYTFDLSEKFLTSDEMAVFKRYLDYMHIDADIWDVFACLFKSSVKGTTPMVIRAYQDSQLCGAAILTRCKKYGKALFNNRLIAGTMDVFGIPYYQWMKFGCCMDMMSNPGFAAEPEKADEIFSAMAQYLRKHCLLTIITDYSDKAYLYKGSSILPALPHALIDTSNMTGIQDYINEHKNIKRKANIYKNNGGTFEIVRNMLNDEEIASVKKCFLVTAEKSVMYLPYQDLYLNSALTTSRTKLDNVYYFIAKINGEFIGYQAALKTGDCLNALHGAFDRERKTTYHAYDLLFARMVKFAIENGLKSIDFGSVINITKQRAVNHTLDMSYFLYSDSTFMQWVFNHFLKKTKIQGEEQLKFRTNA